MPLTSPAIRSSAERSGTSNEIASTWTSVKPASRSRAAKTTSSANWKNDGPAGMPVGGGTSASATAPRIIAKNGERSGASQVDSATRPPERSTRASSSAARSGSPMCWMTMLPRAASNDPSANGKRVAAAWTNCGGRMPSCSNRDHCNSNIDAGRDRSSIGCAARGLSRAGTDVDDARATLDTRGIKQRVDRPACDRAPMVLVLGRDGLPA